MIIAAERGIIVSIGVKNIDMGERIFQSDAKL